MPGGHKSQEGTEPRGMVRRPTRGWRRLGGCFQRRLGRASSERTLSGEKEAELHEAWKIEYSSMHVHLRKE